MNAPRTDYMLVNDTQLPFLLSQPSASAKGGEPLPVLFFLHGYDEGPPAEIHAGLTAHGPLRPGSSPLATEAFLVVAPRLPAKGDFWRFEAEPVREIVECLHRVHAGDPRRTYLTGFSFGGNGVFDLALHFPDLWAALWPVDPTRVPETDPGLPVWLSGGEASRQRSSHFISRLGLVAADESVGDRVFTDEGLDHVRTATSAYRNDAIYRWLLERRRGG